MDTISLPADRSPDLRRMFPDQDSLRAEYEKYLPFRLLAVQELEKRIENAIAPLPSRHRVKGRVKTFNSYFKKYIKHLKSDLSANSTDISDLIGLRIICLFLEDLAVVEELLKKQFKVIEVEQKGGSHTFREFGYVSIHILITIPEDIKIKEGDPNCEIAEIQIRTILQDVWAEVEHELIYKAEFAPFDTLKRKMAAVNASLSLADIVFQDIRIYQQEFNGETGKRRDSFFRKIEESTDAMLFSGENLPPEETGEEVLFSLPSAGVSIDDLLLKALSAHNENQFSEAITIYTRILEIKPDDVVSSIIYKHRGMAYFARSNYEEAIADFSESLRLDPKSYKSAYYEGEVCSVVMRYSQALDAFNRSLEINPYQPYCLFRRGQTYYHLDDYPQALGDCEAALALEPFEAAKKFRGLLLTKLKM